MKNPFRRQAPQPPTPQPTPLLQRNPIWWRMYEPETHTPDTQYLHPTAQARPTADKPYAEANAIMRGELRHD